MKLTDKLKEKEEAKKTIKETADNECRILSDDELDQVDGGEITHDHRLMPLT